MDNQEKPQENIELKKGFFKKVWYSIYKIEKYSDLSAEGFFKAIKYLVLLIILLAVIAGFRSTYQLSTGIIKISDYINDNAPEFTYENKTLKVEDKNQPIEIGEGQYGKIIIDTKTKDQIDKYKKSLQNEENYVIVLNDKLIIKQNNSNEIEYKYESLLNDFGIEKCNKRELVDYLKSNKMMSLYLNYAITYTILSFMIYVMNTLINVLVISIIGFIATLLLRLKIRYVAIFNMAVYSITLSTILNMLYIIVNTFINYTVPYFDVMYVLVASIYILAAVFILKAEFNKKQGKVQKIVEVEKQVKEEIEEQEEKKKTKDEEKDKEVEDNKDEEEPEEPEGSNA